MAMWGIGLALLAGLAAQDAPRGMLGSSWVGADGDQREPRVILELAQPMDADPLLYRRAEHDWAAGSLQVGAYPAMRGEKEGRVALRLTIGADGKLQDCKVTQPSGISALDAHSCPHLLAQAHFFPALGRDGTRLAATTDAVMRYTIRLYMNGPSGDGGAPPPRLQREARPDAPITLQTLGIAPKTRPPANVYGINAALAIGAGGEVTACTLTGPSQIDRVDKTACDRLMALHFAPALDDAGQPVASRFAFSVQWPQ
jgi:TonB family protein